MILKNRYYYSISKILAFCQSTAKLAIINSINALEKPVIFKKDFKNGY